MSGGVSSNPFRVALSPSPSVLVSGVPGVTVSDALGVTAFPAEAEAG
jgi:hypothetical protein